MYHGFVHVCLPLLNDVSKSILSASTVPEFFLQSQPKKPILKSKLLLLSLGTHDSVRVKGHLEKCDLSEAKLFLFSTIGTTAFSDCENFENLLQQLQQDHIDVFKISLLQQLSKFWERQFDRSKNQM